ncbi:hypothetical protein [Priestia aryabhattai]|uniref:hypothetical protein n=1 Tax=Priestia aryabhattai TaxID=412384 RepID=UPI00203F2860|nr:hypothetical protein [Priestia aryabhattai]MCM3255581.1 hypothetical protein [Priestia aryabhattai]
MEHDKSLALVRRGIQWLENRAILDRHLVNPENQEINLNHEQIIIEYLGATKSNGETLTQKNLNALTQNNSEDLPSIFTNYHGELKEYEVNKQRRRANRQKKIEENMSTYFKPSEIALQLNHKAINLAMSKDEDTAIEPFTTAYHSFPSVPPKEFRISNDAYLPICFNLGSVVFNNGNLEDGFQLLTDYYIATNEGDYYRDHFQSLFHIEESFEKRKRIIKATYDGIHFTRNHKGVYVETNNVEEYHRIDLPFKHPVSLNIEYKDKDSPELLDYYFLHQLIPYKEDDVTRYEIILPLKSIPVFIKEFYPSILAEPTLRHELIKSFDEFIAENVIAKGREKVRRRYDYPELYTQYFKSVLFITLPNHLTDAFLEEYRQFIKTYVIHEITDNERDELELESLRKNYEEISGWFRSQLKMEFQLEREHHQHVAKIFADLKTVEQNLCLNKRNLFEIVPGSLHDDYQQSYLQLLDGVFDDITTVENVSKQTDLLNLKDLDFRDNELKISIQHYWSIMLQLVEVDPSAALAKMRLVLEKLLSTILEQEGHSLYGDQYRLTPTQMVLRINQITGEELKDNIVQLHLKSKSCSHIDDNQYLHEILEGESRSEAIKYLEVLRKVTADLVQLFQL